MVALLPHHDPQAYAPPQSARLSVLPTTLVLRVVGEGGCLLIGFGAGSAACSGSPRAATTQNFGTIMSPPPPRVMLPRAFARDTLSEPLNRAGNSRMPPQQPGQAPLLRRSSAIWGEGGSHHRDPRKPLLQPHSLWAAGLRMAPLPFSPLGCDFPVGV